MCVYVCVCVYIYVCIFFHCYQHQVVAFLWQASVTANWVRINGGKGLWIKIMEIRKCISIFSRMQLYIFLLSFLAVWDLKSKRSSAELQACFAFWKLPIVFCFASYRLRFSFFLPFSFKAFMEVLWRFWTNPCGNKTTRLERKDWNCMVILKHYRNLAADLWVSKYVQHESISSFLPGTFLEREQKAWKMVNSLGINFTRILSVQPTQQQRE